jgi:hypothetical protein
MYLLVEEEKPEISTQSHASSQSSGGEAQCRSLCSKWSFRRIGRFALCRSAVVKLCINMEGVQTNVVQTISTGLANLLLYIPYGIIGDCT